MAGESYGEYCVQFFSGNQYMACIIILFGVRVQMFDVFCKTKV